MFGRVRYLFVKELIQVLRDKRLRITLILPPIFQLIVFGYAANLDVKHIHTAIRDLDRSVDSRDLIDRFGSSKYFDIVSHPETPREMEDLIKKGDVVLGIEIPSDFSRKLKKGDTAAVQIIVDGTESNTAMIALGYVNRILSEYSADILLRRMNREGMIGFERGGCGVTSSDLVQSQFRKSALLCPWSDCLHRFSHPHHPDCTSHCERKGDRDS